MQYVGGKFRIAKHILPIILKDRRPGQPYVEPFVGGANVICRVPPEQGPRIGADANLYLIALWKKIQQGWLPPKEFSKQTHARYKEHPEKYPPHQVAFVAMATSFARTWFGTYLLEDKRNGTPHGYTDLFRRNILAQRESLQGVKFIAQDFRKLKIPSFSLIYCDPPYAGVSPYPFGDFNTKEFWLWCDDLVALGHQVFVSEYKAPRGWRCIWKKEMQVNTGQTGLNGKSSLRRVERLFTK